MISLEQLYSLFTKHPRISTDSRNIEKDCIFFALKGDNFNGNKFAKESIAKGAVYAIVDEQEYADEKRIFYVDQVLSTLTDLATLHRRKLDIPILAITGTNGKTTTKELVAAVLSQRFKVSATKGNLNNHIGVPLTLLAMGSDIEFGVVEMGANHPGEIKLLSDIAEPDFGIITNIGKAHLEGFGSFEGVIKTKSELFHAIKQRKGTFFYNKDNELLDQIAGAYHKAFSFGTTTGDLCGIALDSPPYVHVKANFKRGVLYLNSKLTGSYNVENILAAAAIGSFFQIDPLKIQKAIKGYEPTNNRSQLIQKDELKIIMDAYNANPTSVKASVESFHRSYEGDRVVILGDMLELGEYSREEHQAIVDLLVSLDFKHTYLVGKEFCSVRVPAKFSTSSTVEELIEELQVNPIKKGNLLIKGSRGIQLEKVLSVFS